MNQLKENGIEVILNVTTEWSLNKKVENYIKEFKRLDLKDLEDHSHRLEQLFGVANSYIDEIIKTKKQKLLVHWLKKKKIIFIFIFIFINIFFI